MRKKSRAFFEDKQDIEYTTNQRTPRKVENLTKSSKTSKLLFVVRSASEVQHTGHNQIQLLAHLGRNYYPPFTPAGRASQ